MRTQLVQVPAYFFEPALAKTAHFHRGSNVSNLPCLLSHSLCGSSSVAFLRSSEPLVPADVCSSFRLRRLVPPVAHHYLASRLQAMSDARGHSRPLIRRKAGMKSARVATSGQLPEHSAREPELRLDHKVQKVVGHPRVVTWRRVHLDIRKRRALRFYRVPSLTYASKDKYHLRLQVVLPNAGVQLRRAISIHAEGKKLIEMLHAVSCKAL